MARRFTKKAFADLARKKALEGTQEVLVTLLDNLSETTPVDEGVLINNWRFATDPNTVAFRDVAGSAVSMYIREAARIRKVFPGEDTFYFVNKTPYAGYVESGTEHQPAQHYTRRAINRTKRSLE